MQIQVEIVDDELTVREVGRGEFKTTLKDAESLAAQFMDALCPPPPRRFVMQVADYLYRHDEPTSLEEVAKKVCGGATRADLVRTGIALKKLKWVRGADGQYQPPNDWPIYDCTLT